MIGNVSFIFLIDRSTLLTLIKKSTNSYRNVTEKVVNMIFEMIGDTFSREFLLKGKY
jgi:hypothetical protein